MTEFKYDNSGRGYHMCGLTTNKNVWVDPLAKYGANRKPKKTTNNKVTIIQTKKKKGPKRNALGQTKSERRCIEMSFSYITKHGLDSRIEKVKRVYSLISFALPGQPISVENLKNGRLVIDTRLRIGKIIEVNNAVIIVQYEYEKVTYVKKKAYPKYIKIWRFPNKGKHSEKELNLVNLKEQIYKTEIAKLSSYITSEK